MKENYFKRMHRKMLFVALLALFSATVANAQDWGKWCYKDYDNPGTYVYTIPNGCTDIIVEAIGGGGAGGACSGTKLQDLVLDMNYGAGGGGGGGAYARRSMKVTPGEFLDVVVGAGGTSIFNQSPVHGERSTVTYRSAGSSNKGKLIVRAPGGQSLSTNDLEIRVNGLGAGWIVTSGDSTRQYGSYIPESIKGDVCFNGGCGSGEVFGSYGYDISRASGAGGGAGGGCEDGKPGSSPVLNAIPSPAIGGAGGEGCSNKAPAGSGIVWLSGGKGGDGKAHKTDWGCNDGEFPGGGGGGGRTEESQDGGRGANGKVRIWFYIPAHSESVTATCEQPGTRCYGETVTLKADPANTLGSLSYRWSNNSTARNPQITVTQSATYTVTMTDDMYPIYSTGSCNVQKTASVYVPVYPAINPGNIEAGNKVFNKGDAAPTISNVANASGGTGNMQYQWYYRLNNTGEEHLIEGATGTSYTPSETMMNTEGFYTFIRKAKDDASCCLWHKAVSVYNMIVGTGILAADSWDKWCYADFTTAGAARFDVPSGCDKILVEAIGGGGAGGYVYTPSMACVVLSGGGGGGAYARSAVEKVSLGDYLTINVGRGGWSVHNSEGDATNSSASLTQNGKTEVLVKAAHGANAPRNENTCSKRDNTFDGGAGGKSSDCIGDQTYSGGSGSKGLCTAVAMWTANEAKSGAGGGAGGGAENGSDADSSGDDNDKEKSKGGSGGGAGVASSEIGGNYFLSGGRGGDGRNGTSGWGSGAAGSAYGGGGGGSRAHHEPSGDNKMYDGGNGAAGIVRVWYHISSPMTLTVKPITAHICPGTPTEFEAKATGAGTITYKWEDGPSTAKRNISNAGTYTVTATATIGDCSKDIKGSINVTAYPSLNTGTISNSTKTICAGGYCPEIAETGAASGAGALFYRWKMGGTLIAGAESSTYTPEATYTEVAGTYTFTREVMSDLCNQNWAASGGTYTLVVTPKPEARDDSYARNESYSGAITCNVLDNDETALACANPEVTLAVAPLHGTATWDAARRVFTYSANNGYEGDDEFQYLLYCSELECGTVATVRISATALDLACPTAVGTSSYRFANAHTEGIVRSISAGFTEDPENCSVVLPTLPEGWTESGNEYYRFVNVPAGATNADIDSVIHHIVFNVPNNTLKEVSVMVDATEQPAEVFYCSSTQHYYQYLKFQPGEGGLTWMDCYDRAMKRTYLGRQGYLATFTSLEEDKFITRVAGAPAWVGATRLPNSTYKGSQYYDPTTFDTGREKNPQSGDYWYWACGPERGSRLFNAVTYSGTGNDIYYAQSNDAGDYIYSNWGEKEPNSSNGESCLTVLKVSSTNTGYWKHTMNFSWNDKGYASNYIAENSIWNPQGYMVEYGNLPVGHSTEDILETQIRISRKIGNVRDTVRAKLTAVKNETMLCSVTDSAYLKVELEGKAPFSFTLKATADSVERTYTNIYTNVIYVPTTPNPVSKYWLEDLKDKSSLDPCGNELVIFNPDTVITKRDLYGPSFTGILNDVFATGTGCTFQIPDMTDATRAIITDDVTPLEDLIITQKPAAGTPFTASTLITVYVSDACGRTDSTTAMVERPADPTVSITGSKYVCYNGNDTLVATPGGIAPFTFAWNNAAATATNILKNIITTGKNTASVTATDANGCTATASYVYNVYNEFNAGKINVATKVICMNGTANGIGSVQAANGGDNNISYQWFVNDVLIDGATEETFTPGTDYTTVPGKYLFVRKAKDGRCQTDFISSVGTYTLVVNGLTTAGEISTAGQTICQNGTADAIGSTTDAAGQGTLTYKWYADGNLIAGANAATYTPGTAYTGTPGTYVFTRTVKAGTCSTEETATGTYTLVVKANPTILAVADARCVNDNSDGTIEVTVGEGLAPYHISCGTLAHDLTAAGNYTFTGLADGSYPVSVTDANGCVATTANEIKVMPNALTISITSKTNNWTYDGTDHSDNAYTVKMGASSFNGTSGVDLSLGDNLMLNVILSNSIKNVGSVSNTFTYTLTKNAVDVTCNYYVNTVSGTLTIKPASSDEITLTCPSVSDASKAYDGTALQPTATATGIGSENINVEYSLNGVDGWTITAPSLVHADTQAVYVRTANQNYQSATCSYNLAIESRYIKLASESENQCLSVAAPLKKEVVNVTEGSFVAGEGVAYSNFSSLDGMHEENTSNEFTYNFNTGTLASDYRVAVEYGTLSVAKCASDIITLTMPATSTLSKMYDGTKLSVIPTATTTGGQAVTFHYSTNGGATWSTTAPERTHFGTTNVMVKASCFGYDTVSGNYAISITKRDVILTSRDTSGTYNGTTWTRPVVDITGDGFVAGEGVTYKDFASITNVGVKANTFGYDVKPGTQSDDYNIVKNYGTLTVTRASDMTIVDPSALTQTRKYDGTKLQSEVSVDPSEGTTFQYKVGTGAWTNTNPSITHVNESPLNVTVRAINPNYDTVSTTYTLTVTPRLVTLTSASANQCRSVQATLKKEVVTVSGDGFAAGEGINYSNFSSLNGLSLETTANKFDTTYRAGTLKSDYQVDTVCGMLKVYDCPDDHITLTMPDASAIDVMYDGSAHGPVATATATGGQPVTIQYSTNGGSTWSVDAPSRTHFGSTDVMVRATCSGYLEESDAYTIIVRKRDVKLTSRADSRVYNGSSLSNTIIDVTGSGFASGEGASYDNFASITNAGTCANTFTYNFNTGTEADDYDVTVEYGTLTVTRANTMEIDNPTALTQSRKYDGTKLQSEATATPSEGTTFQYKVGAGEWTDTIPYITHVIEGPINVNVRAINQNFDTVYTSYSLTLSPRSVTLTSDNAEQCLSVYAELTKKVVSASGDNFVPGEGASYINFSSLDGRYETTTDNEFDYIFNDGTQGTDYNVNTVYGTLTVTKCASDKITITLPPTETVKGLYNGTSYGTSATASATGGQLVTIEYSTDGGASWTTDAPSVTHADTVNVLVKASCFGYDDANSSYKIEVARRNAILTSRDSSAVYDGSTWSRPSVVVTGDGFIGDEGLNYNNFASITNVGTVNNTFDTTYKAGTLKSDYNILLAYGQLTVTRSSDFRILATSGDLTQEKMYDGSRLFSTPTANVMDGTTFQYKVNGGAWMDTIPYITHVMDGPDTISVRAVNPNYETSEAVTYTLNVLKREMILTSGTDTKVYDGAPLTKEEVVVSGYGFAPGESATFDNYASITNAGTINNTFAIHFAANTLESDYEIEKNYGELTVTGCHDCLTMALPTVPEFKYDATPHSADDVELGGSASTAPETKVEYSTDGGTTWTTVKPAITHSDTIEVVVRVSNPSADTLTGSYILSVAPRNVTLISGSPNKVYDGVALVGGGDLTISGDGFIGTEGIGNVVYTGAQLSVGVSDNSFEFALNAATDTVDYIFTEEFGALTVTKCHDCITITLPTVTSKLYDGEPLEGEATAESSVTGDYVKVEYSTDNGATWSVVVPSVTESDTIEVLVRATNVNCDTVIDNYTLMVNPITDPVEVHIKGHHKTFAFNGDVHTVSGYDLTTDNTLYRRNILTNVHFSGDSTISLTNVDTLPMNLDVADFSNVTPSFTNVTFVLDADGYIAVRNLGPIFDSVADQIAYTDRDKAYHLYTGVGENWEPTVHSENGLASLTYAVSDASNTVTGGNTTLVGQQFKCVKTAVKWTAVDTLGHATYYTQYITVIDTQKPNVTPIADQERLCDSGDSVYTCYSGVWDAQAFDNVKVTSLVCTLSGAKDSTGITTLHKVVFPKGITTVTWTARDAAGNDSTITFKVTVGDFIPPCIGCVNRDPYDTTGVSCATLGTNGNIGVGTDDDEITYTHVGNAWDITAADNDDVSELYYELSGATSTVTVSNTTLNGQVFPIGATYVTWHAKDPSGNESTCVVTVCVGDQEPPCLGCTPEHPDDPTAGVSCESIIANARVHVEDTVYVTPDATKTYYTHTGTYWNVTATDNLGIDSIYYTLSGATTLTAHTATNLNGQKFNSGATVVTWTAKDVVGNVNNCSFVVFVDGEAPVMDCPEDVIGLTSIDLVPVAYTTVAEYVAGGGAATDNVALDSSSFRHTDAPTGNDCEKTILRTYYVKDIVGNESSCTQTITVKDTVKPTFTCPADITIYKDATCSHDADITITGDVTDEADNYSMSQEAIPTDVDATPVDACAGKKIIKRTWSLTDDCGNITTKVQTITVLDTISPTFTRPKDTTICRVNAQIVAPTSALGVTSNWGDNCTPVNSLAESYIDLDTLPNDNSVDRVIRRQWSVTDLCGNVIPQIQNITVRPSILTEANYVFTCPEDVHKVLNYNDCEMYINIGEPIAINNMTGMDVVVTNNAPAGYIFPQGTTYVTWTATDECGDFRSCVQTVVVDFPACGTDAGADAVDANGNVYRTVRIGCQCWMAENLKSVNYQQDNSQVANARDYDNNPDNADIYGKLYSWYSAAKVPEGDDNAVPASVMGPTGPYVQGVCPDGWALPTNANYETLFENAGTVDKLKEANSPYWLPGADGVAPTSGFDARAAGYYDHTSGRYMSLLGETYFWTSEPTQTIVKGHCSVITHSCPEGLLQEQLKGRGQSVRCLRME